MCATSTCDTADKIRLIPAAGPGPLRATDLPPPPPPPAVVNLDVTTLCALVSEVGHGSPERPEMVAWAARVSHWQVCMASLFSQKLDKCMDTAWSTL